jgi:hypothetical protein
VGIIKSSSSVIGESARLAANARIPFHNIPAPTPRATSKTEQTVVLCDETWRMEICGQADGRGA